MKRTTPSRRLSLSKLTLRQIGTVNGGVVTFKCYASQQAACDGSGNTCLPVYCVTLGCSFEPTCQW